MSGDIRLIFFEECEELLEALSDGLQAMADGRDDAETVNAVFRAVHSVKGGAGAFGLEGLVRFAHRFETALDEVRGGRLELDGASLRTMQRAGDRLADLVSRAQDGDDLPADEPDGLTAELDALAGDAEDEEEAVAFQPLAFDAGLLDLDLGAEPGDAPATALRVVFAPHEELYRSGNDPAILLRALAELGELEVALDAEPVSPLDELRVEDSHLAWTMVLRGADEAAIREVFEFVDGICDLEVGPAEEEEPAEPEAMEAPLPEPGPAEPARSGEAEGGAEAPARSAQRQTIRVDLERVDRLINVAGELVITQAVLSQRIGEAGTGASPQVAAAIEDLEGLAREIQDSVMAIRAQPVKPLFQRMQRILREACEATGKPARLVAEGEATEVDKSLIEGLAEPLTHMVRNAVDHGLEAPARRAAANKPEKGVVRLSAGHRSGRVVIEVADDGGGIDRERVRAKAVEKGLVPAEADMTAAEIDQLLFAPGFSTAAEVSDLSGRGVGMDVVSNAIRALGGRVGIASEPGAGTTFSISLPLTLAVLDGMVVEVAGERLVIPLGAVIETLRPSAASVHVLRAGHDVIATREGPLSVLDLGVVMGFRGPRPMSGEDVLVVVEAGAARAALRVDAIRDQRQVVIKGLEANYGPVPGVAAATILGDGRIALIVDPDAVLHANPAAAA